MRKNSSTCIYNFKNISGVIPRIPVKMGEGWDEAGDGEGGEEWKGEGGRGKLRA
jgi:hypothetical protein